ncbi:MAG: MBL fold metallo-hydrolase [Thermodesulfobacteriota bacterium]|nr:MBL fold metallo-hydrolase [Thermodesulfobacteriota bacterium]
MKITIIYDNTAYKSEFTADWGFSALVEAHGKTILFDTGASGRILLSNMKKLGIDPGKIEDVFISHGHFDHTGGLSAFLDLNRQVRVWLPCSIRGVKIAKEVIEVENSLKLYKGLYSTGELEGIEQSLCVETQKGIVIIAGCSHPRMKTILDTASQFGRVYAIIGGLHGTEPKALENVDLICATHCTQYKHELKALYPEKYIEGGVGRVIEIEAL